MQPDALIEELGGDVFLKEVLIFWASSGDAYVSSNDDGVQSGLSLCVYLFAGGSCPSRLKVCLVNGSYSLDGGFWVEGSGVGLVLVDQSNARSSRHHPKKSLTGRTRSVNRARRPKSA